MWRSLDAFMCLQMTQFHSFLWLNNTLFAFLFAEMILSFLSMIPPSFLALMLRFRCSSLTTVRASPEHLIWLGWWGTGPVTLPHPQRMWELWAGEERRRQTHCWSHWKEGQGYVDIWQKPTQCCKAIILQLIFFYFQRKLFKEKTEKNALLIDCLIITIVLYLGRREVDCYVLHSKIKRI